MNLHEFQAKDVLSDYGIPNETGCAYVVLAEGAALTFGDMVTALESSGMAKQKYPERLEIVDAFPRTPAGKIRKNVLRQRIAEKIAAEAETASPKAG